jgi:hypothetical protein
MRLLQIFYWAVFLPEKVPSYLKPSIKTWAGSWSSLESLAF